MKDAFLLAPVQPIIDGEKSARRNTLSVKDHAAGRKLNLKLYIIIISDRNQMRIIIYSVTPV